MATKQPLNLFQKLVEVRLSVPYLKKEAQSQQYNYTGSSQVLGAVRQKLDEHGVLLTTKIISRNVVPREKPNSKGGTSITYEVDMDLMYTWINSENPEEKIEIPWFAMGLDTGDNAKAIGKALTYAEKYFMLKQFNIATDKDDPDTFEKKAENYVVDKTEASEDNIGLFKARAEHYANLRGQKVSALYTALQIKDPDKLTQAQLDKHLEAVEGWIAKEEAKVQQGA